jgi:hypothetical protein
MLIDGKKQKLELQKLLNIDIEKHYIVNWIAENEKAPISKHLYISTKNWKCPNHITIFTFSRRQ